MRDDSDLIWSEAIQKERQNSEFRRQTRLASRLGVGSKGEGGIQNDGFILKYPGNPGQTPCELDQTQGLWSK